jgi:hypothetical protein
MDVSPRGRGVGWSEVGICLAAVKLPGCNVNKGLISAQLITLVTRSSSPTPQPLLKTAITTVAPINRLCVVTPSLCDIFKKRKASLLPLSPKLLLIFYTANWLYVLPFNCLLAVDVSLFSVYLFLPLIFSPSISNPGKSLRQKAYITPGLCTRILLYRTPS